MVRIHRDDISACGVVPYLASAGWYRAYAESLYGGASEEDAREAATAACGLTARDLCRAMVVSPSGGETLLSVAVEGGSASVKRLRPQALRLSLHGRWPHVHLGALSACYGRTPFYLHFAHELFSPIENVGENSSCAVGLPALTGAIHDGVVRCLGLDRAIEAFLGADACRRRRAAESGRRMADSEDFSLSAVGMLMRRGREAVLPLLARVLACVAAVVLSMAVSTASAQTEPDDDTPKVNVKVYTGFYRFVDEYGDTVRMTLIRDLYVYPPLKFKSKKAEEFYWRTVRDVRKTLPYAKLAFATLCETYEYIQTIPDKKKREAHLKRLEHDIFEQYKPVIRNMTKRQGKVLLKLINRETDQSSYNIVKAFLGSFRAGFWQTFGRFFGMNMKAGFHPEKNEEDAIIDRVATLIEQGTL